MTPEQRIKELEIKVEALERDRQDILERTYMDRDLQINGKLYADKIYTKRSGSYAELTT